MSETMEGMLAIVDASGTRRLQLDANKGDLKVINEEGQVVAHLHKAGGLVLGSETQDGAVHLRNSRGDYTAHISGEDGDVNGKALAPLATGQGSVPILVSLQ